jgi:hypothetical protein
MGQETGTGFAAVSNFIRTGVSVTKQSRQRAFKDWDGNLRNTNSNSEYSIGFQGVEFVLIGSKQKKNTASRKKISAKRQSEGER